jgi:hypothetical protein
MQATPGDGKGKFGVVLHSPLPFHDVIPAQAGIQGGSAESAVFVALDPRLRGDDGVVGA